MNAVENQSIYLMGDDRLYAFDARASNDNASENDQKIAMARRVLV